MYELSPASGKSIGIYVYAVGLLRALKTRIPDGMQLVVPCHGDNLADLQSTAGPGVQLVPLLDAHPGLLRRQWWWRFGAQWTARRLGCEVYFSPKGFIPGWWGGAWGLRTCVVVHDLIPLWYRRFFPRHFGWLEERLVNQGLLRTCRHADHVIAISEATAQDIVELGGRRGPMTIIYNGLDAPPPPSPAPIRLAPFILAMCSDLPHKNAATILDGYRLYRHIVKDALPLVVCGLQGDPPPGVAFVKGLSRAELFAYYRDASVFVFMSRTEGFGYPPLEAMQQGTLTICADLPVLRETTQGNAVFVDPLKPQALAQALEQCLSPAWDAERAAMVQRAPSVVGAYAWARTADGVMSVFKQLMRR